MEQDKSGARVSRRGLLSGPLALVGGLARRAWPQDGRPVVEAFDHLLLGVPDLDGGIGWLQEKTGIKSAFGGVHPGRGTRNALVSLGGTHYLEIIAPDPAQLAGSSQTYALSDLKEPRLIQFAVHTEDLEGVAKRLRTAGVKLSGPAPGSRRAPWGELLEWRTLAIEEEGFRKDGVDPIPFFIEWSKGTKHPSATSPRGCRITSVRFEDSAPDRLRAELKRLGLDADVMAGEKTRIRATVESPKGRVEIG